MAQPMNKQTTARQVELITGQLKSLGTLAPIAGGVLRRLHQASESPKTLAEFLECDPAMHAMLLSKGASLGLINGRPVGMEELVQMFSPQRLKDAVLSVRVSAEDAEPSDDGLAQMHKNLLIHSLAVGCAARELAEILLPDTQRAYAFTAGLLHDLGKLALLEVMPKSYLKIVEQVRREGLPLGRAEQQHLGMDHATIGKRLAERWQLPACVQAAIWLHHSDPFLPADSLEHGHLIQLVHLADLLVRQAKIADSGNPQPPRDLEVLAEQVRISGPRLKELTERVAEQISTKCAMLGLDKQPDTFAYNRTLQETASELARDHAALYESGDRSRILVRQVELQNAFLQRLGAGDSQERLGFHLAQTVHQWTAAAVAVVLAPNSEENLACGFLVDRQGHEQTSLLSIPPRKRIVSSRLQGDFCAVPLDTESDWLIEKLEGRIHPAICLMCPLLTAGPARAVLLLEAMSPAKEVAARLELLCRTSSVMLNTAVMTENQRLLSEQFAALLGREKETHRPSDKEILEGIAEMAAGAAHEMNNPLSVISGRAQYLVSEEQDPDKKEMLEQIQVRAGQLSDIIRDIQDYAHPRQPNPSMIPVGELIGQAIERAAQTLNLTQPECYTRDLENLGNAYVDVEQLVKSVAAVITNAFQAYGPDLGPVRIAPADSSPPQSAAFTIQDSGSGMNPEVLGKAVQPFFSAPPAGRRRGMGLALAYRWIRLNNGQIRITSTPGQGTSVTVILPRG